MVEGGEEGDGQVPREVGLVLGPPLHCEAHKAKFPVTASFGYLLFILSKLFFPMARYKKSF